MSRALSPVTGKPYGLATVCRVWRLARSCVYRHLSAAPTAAQRRGPRGFAGIGNVTLNNTSRYGYGAGTAGGRGVP